jgi:hypothetical protein
MNYKDLLKSRMDERSKSIIERIEKDLILDGHVKTEVKERSNESLTQLDSYFDVLVDLKLNGKPEPTAKEVWENAKAYTNELEAMIRTVAKDYRMLEIKFKGLTKDYEEVIREKK